MGKIYGFMFSKENHRKVDASLYANWQIQWHMLDKNKTVGELIYTLTLGNGELSTFGTLPNLTAFYFGGKDGKKVCKVDTGGREHDHSNYAELCIPVIDISFETGKAISEEVAIKQLEKLKRARFDRLVSSAQSSKNKILLDDSVMMVRTKPTCIMAEGTERQIWYEEIAIALMTKKKRGEPRNEYSKIYWTPLHDVGCHIFSRGKKPYHGICTCGAGLDYFRSSGSTLHLTAKR